MHLEPFFSYRRSHVITALEMHGHHVTLHVKPKQTLKLMSVSSAVCVSFRLSRVTFRSKKNKQKKEQENSTLKHWCRGF